MLSVMLMSNPNQEVSKNLCWNTPQLQGRTLNQVTKEDNKLKGHGKADQWDSWAPSCTMESVIIQAKHSGTICLFVLLTWCYSWNLHQDSMSAKGLKVREHRPYIPQTCVSSRKSLYSDCWCMWYIHRWIEQPSTRVVTYFPLVCISPWLLRLPTSKTVVHMGIIYSPQPSFWAEDRGLCFLPR